MALEATIGGGGALIIGEDKTLKHFINDTEGVPLDLSGLTIHFVVRLKDSSADPVILELPADIVGVYAADDTNTQYAEVELTDDQTNLFTAQGTGENSKTYRYSWKIMDEPETVTGYGDFILERVTAR